jgi:hypothetical protein
MACFEPTGDVVMMLGEGPAMLADAWRLQGSVWSQLPGPLPPVRTRAAMVCDAQRQRLVLFGGYSLGSYLSDTWEWDGTAWLLRASNGPPAREGHAMAYDRDRRVTVLFGGLAYAGHVQDLWEWNGTAWAQRAAPAGPSPRRAAHMAFDPVHRTVLLQGGAYSPPGGQDVLRNDTWSWDGAAWVQLFPATPPPFALGSSMAGDPHRARILLHGGLAADAFAREWDGSEWRIVLQSSPSGRQDHAMAYDMVGRRTVLFGGLFWQGGSAFYYGDTWIFRTPTPADVVPFGAGCAGTAGVPALANAPYSLPWLGGTLTNRVRNLAPAAAGVVFATGFASTAPISLAIYGMPGCDQLVLPATTEFGVATAGGAEWTLAIPNTAALANVHLFQQVFALDPAANALGLTASNGIEIITGIR